MTLRQEVLKILFKKFGKGDYSNKSIYECADEWVAKGHKISSGIVKYYDAYYNK
jgi:polyhydroxyalkanoate synthesis regulator phasin